MRRERRLISKIQLKSYLDSIQTYLDKIKCLSNAMKVAFEPPIIFNGGDGLLSSLISVLESEFGDSISWYIFECDFGKTSKQASVNDVVFEISNFEAFWEFLRYDNPN